MIVCMSRRICVELYKEIAKLRPGWHDNDDEKGRLKVVMTGSAADVLDFQPHIRNKQRRERVAERFKDENDPLKLVLVRDMWLTGFDVPCLHTMYADKPMQRHGLMQAIARVNRVFKDKPGGLVVDYLGLADQLKKALTDYTESGGKGKPVFDQEEAVAKMLEYYEICAGLFHGFDYSRFKTGKPRERLPKTVTQLSKAFALSVPHDRAIAIRDDVAFFQTVRAALAKTITTGGRDEEELNLAVRQS